MDHQVRGIASLFQYLICKLIAGTPPPGGFLCWVLPWSRAVCTRFHDEMRPSYLVVKSFTHGSWLENIVNRKPPWEGGFLSIKVSSWRLVGALCSWHLDGSTNSWYWMTHLVSEHLMCMWVRESLSIWCASEFVTIGWRIESVILKMITHSIYVYVTHWIDALSSWLIEYLMFNWVRDDWLTYWVSNIENDHALNLCRDDSLDWRIEFVIFSLTHWVRGVQMTHRIRESPMCSCYLFRIHRALFRIYWAFFRIYRALLIYSALLRIYWALLRTCYACLQIMCSSYIFRIYRAPSRI